MEDYQSSDQNKQAGSLNKEPASKMTNFTKGMLCGTLITLVALLLGFAVFHGVKMVLLFSGNNQEKAETDPNKEVVTADTNRKMMAIEEVIHNCYLKDVDRETLENGIYSGMVESLGDPYSEYFPKEELEEMQREVEGVYFGIGAYVSLDDLTGLPMISGVIEGTPAEEADLREGDLIYKVEDVSTQGMTTSDVVKLIRGEEGTRVHITLVREGADDYVEVDVERRQVESPTVKHEMLEDNIAYIQILEFDKVTVDQFTEALAVCKGSGMEALVLDLRSNPGGSLDSVCEIARKILPKGLIVYTEDKNGKREEFSCDGENELTVPMVVLVNDFSASASEILTGAIKDYGMGTVMGTNTFGKGIVQRIIGLSDGSAVKLTISNYYTPKGTNIHGVGIAPDVEVEFDAKAFYEDKVDNQKDAAVEYLKKNFSLDKAE